MLIKKTLLIFSPEIYCILFVFFSHSLRELMVYTIVAKHNFQCAYSKIRCVQEWEKTLLERNNWNLVTKELFTISVFPYVHTLCSYSRSSIQHLDSISWGSCWAGIPTDILAGRPAFRGLKDYDIGWRKKVLNP